MKKIMLVALCTILSAGAFAQKNTTAVGLTASYGTEIKSFGIGAKAQYSFTDAIRAEASFDYFLEKDGLKMWDINLNAHYLFSIGEKLKVYPLAGLSFTHWTVDLGPLKEFSELAGVSASDSKFGFNLGGGIQYDLTSNLFVNAEAKYQFISDFDQAVFSVGLAYRF